MKLRTLIKKLEEANKKFISKHGIEPDIFDVYSGFAIDDEDPVIEIGKVTRRGGLRYCYKMKKIRIRP